MDSTCGKKEEFKVGTYPFFVFFIVFLFIFMGGIAGCKKNNPLETSRDDKGVWYITGDPHEKLYNIFEAMGYAVAKDRLWQAELYRRQAKGTLSEIFGSNQLETDIFVRTIAYTDAELEAGFRMLSEDTQNVINGYAAGFNRRIREIKDNPDQLPFEFEAMGEQLGITFMPDKWTYKDILAWTAWLQRSFDPEALQTGQVNNVALYQKLYEKFGEDGPAMYEDLRWTNDPDAPTVVIDEETFDYQITSTMNPLSLAADNGEPPALSANNFSAAAGAMNTRREACIDNLKRINAHVKMGSYAWVISGNHTATGNPILYSGPQMGFQVPSIVTEGAINAGGLNISGMTVPGMPIIIIGRTPHHSWSMQVGHAHTTDYYVENVDNIMLNRMETIKVAGEEDLVIPIFRSTHGPVVSPMPYDPDNYREDADGPIIAWKYAHWGYEFESIEGFLQLAKATGMEQFSEGIENIAVSQHFCYADRDGNIAYWMSGRDPVRPIGEWRLPQGALGPALEWDAAVLKERSTSRNTARGYYAGWNNKTHPDYDNSYNSSRDIYGPFHRAHVIYDYLDEKIEQQVRLTFEDIRDLAINIATTDSLDTGGGNSWAFVKEIFIAAVNAAGMTAQRETALSILADWDGHFVYGGEALWPDGPDRADGWILMNEWINAVLDLTFSDEGMDDQSDLILFNVLLHGLEQNSNGIQNQYDWFSNLEDPFAPQTAEDIIVSALDQAISSLDPANRPWGNNGRREITFYHSILGPIHTMPLSLRSTYAQCVEYGGKGPVRIESMFPLGQSGNILSTDEGHPVFDENYFSMSRDSDGNPILFDLFEMREFALFEEP